MSRVSSQDINRGKEEENSTEEKNQGSGTNKELPIGLGHMEPKVVRVMQNCIRQLPNNKR